LQKGFFWRSDLQATGRIAVSTGRSKLTVLPDFRYR
jgi:hypothetical protein